MIIKFDFVYPASGKEPPLEACDIRLNINPPKIDDRIEFEKCFWLVTAIQQYCSAKDDFYSFYTATCTQDGNAPALKDWGDSEKKVLTLYIDGVDLLHDFSVSDLPIRENTAALCFAPLHERHAPASGFDMVMVCADWSPALLN